MYRFRLSPLVSLVAVLVLGVVPSLAITSVAAPSSQPVLQVQPVVHPSISPPLRSLSTSPAARSVQPRVHPLRRAPQASTGAAQSDPVVQSSVGPEVGTTAGLNFDGVGIPIYSPGGIPPDTEGAVGATQYMQWVNTDLAIFNKSTGALILGPIPGNALWSNTGDGCAFNNDGDPIVQYDKVANRWVITQFSVTNGPPFLECVAVSLTNDATGSYYLYDFPQPNFNDYPKMSVWPDGYYITYNMFNGNTFTGARVCAMQRSAMLSGNPAYDLCFQFNSSVFGLLPSDQDGPTQPPAGSPNYVVNFGTNALNLWKFHVDYVNQANSTLTGPTPIPVAAFSPACNGGTCIPQPSTSQKLDSLGDRLMYRLAYRNFGNHESLVVNHSVKAGTSVGVRWYELRSPGSTPTVFQQGTFHPDATYRWMGSIAMDKVGDIAVGYSASSSSVFPSVRYTGRVPTDALGTLEAEKTIKAGGGSQHDPFQSVSRWGDYSAMTVDPVNDCTFWYTNEYLKTSGSFNWSTRIASFKFPGCH